VVVLQGERLRRRAPRHDLDRIPPARYVGYPTPKKIDFRAAGTKSRCPHSWRASHPDRAGVARWLNPYHSRLRSRVATTTRRTARRLEGNRDRSGLDSGSTSAHPGCSRRKARGDFRPVTGANSSARGCMRDRSCLCGKVRSVASLSSTRSWAL
jgi:hypothetical protein